MRVCLNFKSGENMSMMMSKNEIIRNPMHKNRNADGIGGIVLRYSQITEIIKISGRIINKSEEPENERSDCMRPSSQIQ
jgi:hypothetical protein